MSYPKAKHSSFVLYASRMRRLTRFRTTALPTLGETVMPRRFSQVLFFLQYPAKTGVTADFPLAYNLRKSRLYRSGFVKRMELMGQPDPALCTAACKNFSAVLRFHSLKKPVDLAALAFFGLIRPDHLCHTSQDGYFPQIQKSSVFLLPLIRFIIVDAKEILL